MSYQRIAEIMEELSAMGVPAYVVQRAEQAAVNAVARAEKAKRAQMLLPFGAAAAAERLGCHRATVYRRAKLSRVSPALATGS